MEGCIFACDKDLVEGCVLRKEGAWEEFIARYRRLIRVSIEIVRSKYTGTRPDLDDLESFVYEKLLEKDCRRLRAWRQDARFSTYLVVVSRNLARDFCLASSSAHLRDQEPLPPRFDELSFLNSIEEREWQAAREKAVAAALNDISDHQATIVRLRMQGRTLKEIAELTNRPIGTVSVENSRALGRLRKAVSDHFENVMSA